MSRGVFSWTLSGLFAAVLLGSLGVASGVADAAELTLNWTDNAGGTAAFKVERRTTSTGFAQIATTGSGVTTHVDTTVATGTTYCYRVRASNAAGDSEYSNEACGSVTARFDLTVAKAGTGSGTVVSSPPGIDCGSDCTESYDPGSVVTLTENPASGSVFNGWSGGGCTGTAPCVMTGNTPVTVSATFTLSGSPADTIPPTGTPLEDDATIQSLVAPTIVGVDAPFSIEVTLRNSGTTTWVPGAYFLGDPADLATVWGSISNPSCGQSRRVRTAR